MSRQLRNWFSGAQYHVICRGNRKNTVFWSFDDYNVYLIILGNARAKYPFQLLTYCLMPNHIHLQIKTGDVDISIIMKYVNQRYSMYFNKKYDLVGRLFQGRFKTVLIGTEASTYHVSRYIHMNPVKANMVSKPEDYEWSSYNGYKHIGVNKIVDTEILMAYYGSFKAYEKFVLAYRKTSKGQEGPR